MKKMASTKRRTTYNEETTKWKNTKAGLRSLPARIEVILWKRGEDDVKILVEGKHCRAEVRVYRDPKKDDQREYKKKTRKGDKRGEEEIMH